VRRELRVAPFSLIVRASLLYTAISQIEPRFANRFNEPTISLRLHDRCSVECT